MRIAFDIDDTLIPCAHDFPVERPRRKLLASVLSHESLRKGTGELLQYLRQNKCDIWVYTTSHRRPLELRKLFFLYGAWLGGAVNEDIHRRRVIQLGERYKNLVKYPPAFGIDLLFDDSEAVWLEGKQWRYSVVPVRPDDRDWTDTVMSAVETALAGRRG